MVENLITLAIAILILVGIDRLGAIHEGLYTK